MDHRMKRRTFLAAGTSLLLVPSAFAQPSRKLARVGILSSTSPETRSVYWDSFTAEMARLGWKEGREVTYVMRYARGDYSRFDALAAELVGQKPDLLFAGSQAGATALKRSSLTIPIVFANANDPVGGGLVASLARPGGNVTGVSSQSTALLAKAFDLLVEIVPRVKRIGLLVNPENAGTAGYREVAAKAAAHLRVTLVGAAASGGNELEAAVHRMATEGVQAVAVPADPMMLVERRRLNALLEKARLPAAFGIREHAVDGALLTYAPDVAANFQYAAGYVDRILKGAKPADLPVEQADKFQLVLNLKTAKTLGITISPAVLARAHEVIR